MVNVPKVPGVPALPSYSANNISLLVADVTFAINSLFGPQWGIFLDGAQAFPYQSILDFDYKQDFPISDYQVEEGGFQSYDKVTLPFDVKVRVVSGGSESEREALLTAVHDAAATLDLFDVVSPERTYVGCNITHFDYKRSSSSGVGIIIIDIWFTEVRESATATFANTQQPGVAGQQNTGSVTAQPAGQAINQNFDNETWSLQ